MWTSFPVGFTSFLILYSFVSFSLKLIHRLTCVPNSTVTGLLCTSMQRSCTRAGQTSVLCTSELTPKRHEALAPYPTVTRLCKCLFGIYFTFMADHESVKFIFSLRTTLAKFSTAVSNGGMVLVTIPNSFYIVMHLQFISGLFISLHHIRRISCPLFVNANTFVNRCDLFNETPEYKPFCSVLFSKCSSSIR